MNRRQFVKSTGASLALAGLLGTNSLAEKKPDPKKNILQINYWTLGGFEGNKKPEEVLAEAKKIGYQGLELCYDGKEFGLGATQKRCAQIRTAADKLGMKLETLASGAYWGDSLGSTDPAKRNKAISYTKEYLQVAKWIGAESVLVLPGIVAVPWDKSHPITSYKKVWENSTKSLQACLPTAEKLKVNIALENVWSWFLTDPIAMREYVDQFNSERLGVYFDVGNCAINGCPEHWIEILGKRIKAVHLKNFNRENCGGTLAGFGENILEGAVDIPAMIAYLRKQGYTGPMTAEMLPFVRLPDLNLPDYKLADDTYKRLAKYF